MSASLEHGPKYKCRKINRGHHTLEMRTNGARHDIPNTNHLGEKGRRKEGDLKEYINEGKKLNPKPTDISIWLISTFLHLTLFACTWETVP